MIQDIPKLPDNRTGIDPENKRKFVRKKKYNIEFGWNNPLSNYSTIPFAPIPFPPISFPLSHFPLPHSQKYDKKKKQGTTTIIISHYPTIPVPTIPFSTTP